MKNYSGSGVLPIYILNKIPYIVTFTSSKGIITDAGGKKEYNDSIIYTASRELFEESAGLIKINEDDLTNNSVYIDLKHNDKYYRSYFIIINDIDTEYYDDNLKKFKKFKFNPFTETHGIKLMRLDNIDIDDNKIKLISNNNYKLVLAPRLNSIIKKVLKKYNNLNKFYKQIKKNINIINLKKNKLNIDTYEYDTKKNIKITNITTFISTNIY
jgi:hypothetical protein